MPLSFTITAADNEGDNLTYNATGLPQGAEFSNATATFAWTPAFEQSGVYALAFNASDGLAFDYELVNLTVFNANQMPVIENVTNRTVLEGSEMKFFVNSSDPDGDSVSVVAYVPPKLGSASLNKSTKEFKWTPSFNDSGAYEVIFSATDGQLSSNASVNITVVNVNRAPSFTNLANLTVKENELLQFTAAVSDPESDSVVINATGLPIGAAFSNSTANLTWIPGFEQAGAYELKFTASDGVASVTKTTNVTVLNTNRAPVITSAYGKVAVNETEEVLVLVTGTDPDGDSVTYKLNDTRFALLASTNAEANFSWQTSYEDAGFYVVLATVSDSSLTASKEVLVTVRNVNRAPKVAPVGNKTVNENETLSFFVEAVDADNDSLRWSVDADPLGIKLNRNTGNFSWTPTFDQAGTYEVTFTVSESSGDLSASENINITVIDVNRPPVILTMLVDPPGTEMREGERKTLTVLSNDPDGIGLKFEWKLDNRTVLTSHSAYTYAPGYNDSGQHVIEVGVSDGKITVYKQIFVTVLDVVNPEASCTTLLKLVSASLNSRCADRSYSEVADVNKDGVVDLLDIALVGKKFSDKAWCESMLNNHS
ncbi:MAG: Ig-like domain-containing protein, partial [Nanoarchaeota archaeon]